MNNITPEKLLDSIFSDETACFRSPAEPDPGDAVTVRLRLAKGVGARLTVLYDFPARQIAMKRFRTDAVFDWYEATLPHLDHATHFYSFLIEWRNGLILCDRNGTRWVEAVPSPDASHAFRLIPGFHVPEWSKGAVQYQIMPDRFRNGDSRTDVLEREYVYGRDYIHRAVHWDMPPADDGYRWFYGGDLVGVRQKLDYLQSLGVEAIYFNPIFVSPSSHGYDTQDYGHVDPHLTVIQRDGGRVLERGEISNSRATKYRQRTTNPDNLAASDAWFAGFCRELHRRGMRIILDGVFNHCGSFHYWMNREGVYTGVNGYAEGAYGNPHSPCRSAFRFKSGWEYDCWWDNKTLPKLCYEQSLALSGTILRIAEKWVSPPYSVDGWRLDVAADLGFTREFNHLFWKAFRRRVKAANPDAVIIAEHYGNPAEWLCGDEWDSVMNYDGFMEPVSWFLTGMEKHSDGKRDDLYQNGEAFFNMTRDAMLRMPTPSVQCAMNQLSNHDHSRFMTRTNGRVGRLHHLGRDAAAEGIRPEIYRAATVLLMTWPGAPTLYYGDEAGVVGWTDPDNRRTYPWGHEDKALLDFHRALAKLRAALPVLRQGSVKPLSAGWGTIAYARFDADALVIVACNSAQQPESLHLPLWDVGVTDGTIMVQRFITSDQGFSATPENAGTVKNGLFA
ncbi:MAG: glycoside hydrolase family 13 protein, partial [bacterium]